MLVQTDRNNSLAPKANFFTKASLLFYDVSPTLVRQGVW